MAMPTQSLVLEVQERTPDQKASMLRKMAKIPAEYYGTGKQNLHFAADYQRFRKLYQHAGENTIVHLSCGSKQLPVLICDVQFDPVTDLISHVDFKHVDMDKEVYAKVKVVVVGSAPAVKNLGGVIEITKHFIEIKCLPKDLIHEIQVDVSGLELINASVHIRDLKISDAIKVQADVGEVVVKVAAPRKEEEEVKPVEAAVEGQAAAVSAEGQSAAAAAGGEKSAPGASAQEGGQKK